MSSTPTMRIELERVSALLAIIGNTIILSVTNCKNCKKIKQNKAYSTPTCLNKKNERILFVHYKLATLLVGGWKLKM